MKQTSIDIIRNFLSRHKIDIMPEIYLKDILIHSDELQELPEDIVEKIIADGYEAASELVKYISNYIYDKHEILIGRIQKNQLKKYIEYRREEDYNIFIELIKQDIPKDLKLRELISNAINDSNKYYIDEAISEFIKNLQNSLNEGNNDRVLDYLTFLYSRLVNLNERRNSSVKSIFNENEKIIKKELSKEDYIFIKNICIDSNNEEPREKAVEHFNKQYIKLLEKNGNYEQKNSIIYVKIDQMLFDLFDSKELFYNYLFNLISLSYDKLQNHKTLAIRIENIMDGDLNIKWEIYAYLTIFAEKFKRIELNYVFYKPEEICIDVLEHRYKIKLNDSQYSNLKKYYSGEIKIDSLMSNFASSEEDIKKTLEFFNKINTGFNFIDCYVIQDKVCKNSKEIEFIENNSELLLIFDKHLIDERKIPCPVCGSLKISGNSYPEIGVKSWECKNPLCSERSKTNRGKRYSERTILMQNSAFDFSEQNQIPKSLVKKWRKDVIETIEESDFYRMLVKYYSYPGDKITVVNEKNTIIRDITQREKRELLVVPAAEFLPLEKVDESLYYNFMDNNEFFDNFLYIKNSNEHSNINFEDISRKNRKVKFIHGDSFEVLEAIGENVIHNMVTSPPYYNAREYSQWQNLYNYLNDMFGIICKSFKSLVPGGVFFYNIGDTFDNENIVVKSKMGEKRIPLGAYTILLFQKAGFELLDNVIWYKGEPQTNRHKNDGNYTPYYQRPANCYEHMFIFKKPGKLKLNEVINENSITSNIIKFTPVFKIFKGENKYGHTAPFPKKIPELSVNTFTNEEEIVLDPFSGSGTSAIVATLLNRVGVGIEINKEYVELSSSKAKEEGLSSEIIKE